VTGEISRRLDQYRAGRRDVGHWDPLHGDRTTIGWGKPTEVQIDTTIKGHCNEEGSDRRNL